MSVIQQLSHHFWAPLWLWEMWAVFLERLVGLIWTVKNQIFQKFGVVHFVWSGSSLREQSSKLPFVSRPALASAASLPASSRRFKEIYKLWVFYIQTSGKISVRSKADWRHNGTDNSQTIHNKEYRLCSGWGEQYRKITIQNRQLHPSTSNKGNH